MLDRWEDYHPIQEMGVVTEINSRWPLGQKWNRGYEIAKKMNPDAVLHLGSDDWFTENYCDYIKEWLTDHEIVGIGDYHFAHFDFKINRQWDGYDVSKALCKKSIVYWPGYDIEKYSHRENEPVGGGRLIRSDFLDMINWQPFDSKTFKNLDYQMASKCKEAGCYMKAIKDGNIKAVSITTNLWPCKNGYLKMKDSGNELADEFIDKHFPEINEIWSA